MRLGEILLEYKRDITVQKLGAQLLKKAIEEREYSMSKDADQATRDLITDDIISRLEFCDPTKKKIYVQWACREYLRGRFRLEDNGRINDVLTKFEQYKSKLPNKDINQYEFHALEELVDKITNGDQDDDTEESGIGGFPVVPDSKVLYNGPLGQLAIPETVEAAMKLGSGTKWCTSAKNHNMFDHYDAQGPLYIWRDQYGDKYQFHFESNQFMNAQDRELGSADLYDLRHTAPVFKFVFEPAEERIIRKAPLSIEGVENAVKYSNKVLGGKWPALEESLSGTYLALYLAYVNKVATPDQLASICTSENEHALLKYGMTSGVRLPEKAEHTIVKNIYQTDIGDLFEYMLETFTRGDKWPDGEKLLIKWGKPSWLLQYLDIYVQDRWPEAEYRFKEDGKHTWKQYEDIIKRFT